MFFPSGANGPAFIVTENFAVLKEYNNSDAYAIAVGHLADRINGGPPIKAAWPADDHPISRDARIALQKKLSALGYKVNDFEGHVDFDLRDNIRAEQVKLGMLPDGNPTRGVSRKAWREGAVRAQKIRKAQERPPLFRAVAVSLSASRRTISSR